MAEPSALPPVDLDCLVGLAQAGDAKARDEVVARSVAVVRRCAGRWNVGWKKLDKSDLLQEGLLGVLDALKKYQPERGCPFSSFVVFRIHAYMSMYIRKEIVVSSGAVRLPNGRFEFPDRLWDIVESYLRPRIPWLGLVVGRFCFNRSQGSHPPCVRSWMPALRRRACPRLPSSSAAARRMSGCGR